METLEALDQLVKRGMARSGSPSRSAFLRELKVNEPNFYKWRRALKGGHDGPTLRTLLPLLEAAGVFSTGGDEAEELRRLKESLLGEVDRLEARAVELEAQQKPQNPTPGAAPVLPETPEKGANQHEH